MAKERKMFVGVVWNCATELKILLTALLFLCSIITVLQFLPARISFSASDLRNCISTATKQVMPDIKDAPPSVTVPEQIAPPPHELNSNLEQVVDGGVIKRGFNTYGTAAYNFIIMSAYRGGLNTFAIIGLASKPLHVFGKPTYLCEWIPRASNGSLQEPITSAGYKILPDWGYGRVYTTVVVNCTFPD